MAGLEDYFYDLELSHEAEANAHGYETWAEYQEALEIQLKVQLEFWGRIAQEYRDGRLFKKVKEEMQRRIKYDY